MLVARVSELEMEASGRKATREARRSDAEMHTRVAIVKGFILYCTVMHDATDKVPWYTTVEIFRHVDVN